MAVATPTEFTTAAPGVSLRVFTDKELRCLQIYAFAYMIANVTTVTQTDYTANLANSATSLLNVARASTLGAMSSTREVFKGQVMSLLYRMGIITATTSASSIKALIKPLYECSELDVARCEAYLMKLLSSGNNF